MKNWLIYFSILVGVQGWGQGDSTYLSDWELNTINYQQIINQYSTYDLLDYSSGIDRNYIKKFRIDSLAKNTIVADDWLALYHAFKTKDRSVNYEDSTLVFTKKLFSSWNGRTMSNELLTLPIGVIFQNGTLIKNEKYNESDIYFTQDQANYGWNISENSIFDSLIETHDYFSSALLYDETVFDQEVYFTFDTNFTVFSSKKISHLKLEIQNEFFYLYPSDSVKVFLGTETNNINIGVYFDDSTYYENIQYFETDTSFFDSEEKSSPFTGGVHSFPDTGDDLTIEFNEEIFFTIVSSPAPISSYKIRYGIIWGACNTSGKLKKPIFMLHGLRPTIQPWMPTLKKLYRKKFNFKGTDYGADGMVDLLVKNGFDVVICRIDPGYMSIRLGARVLSSFFENVVEPQKEQNGSKYENIVLGFSMGGHYWRNMLMFDEHEHLNLGKNKHHHTRMWIPVDSPLEGANNPLAHQFASKSVAEHSAGFPVFNIAYINMTAAGSQEQQRYDMNGVNGFDGAYHRFHAYRNNYLNEMENTFYLGTQLTKYRGYPSSTRNVAISVGSNAANYYDISPNNVPYTTYNQNSSFPTLLGIKFWDVKLYKASFISSTTSIINAPKRVFKRKIYRQGFFGTNVLVDDHFETYDWLHMDDCNGSYINSIKNTVNSALNWNSLLGFGADVYKENQVFVPTLSALGISPSQWPHDMRYNLKTNKLMFDELTDNILNVNHQNDYYGYPHLGRPTDYQNLTPMDAIFCDELTYEHITLINDENNQDDQSELITFLLNEIQPWYLDLQNQNLGEYARTDYRYKAKYEARNVIRTGSNISPKTPFGDFVIKPNTDLEIQAGDEINLKFGTHIQAGSITHLYIQDLCYSSSGGKNLSQKNTQSATDMLDINEHKQKDFDEVFEDKTAQLRVYPNPNSGQMQIYMNPVVEGDLTIYDISGIEIFKAMVKNQDFITLPANSVGIFVGILNTEKGDIYRTKIVIR